jgi:HEAT repeat protein
MALPFKVLRETQNPKAAEPLVALLGDPDSDIRSRAAAALGPLGGEQAARALCSILSKAEGDELLQIGWALDRLAWKGAVDPLIVALERTSESYAMTALVGTLRKCGAGDRGFKVLIKGLSKGDGPAWECLAALYELKDPCATAEVQSLLQRTSDQKLIRIAKMYLQAHKAI